MTGPNSAARWELRENEDPRVNAEYQLDAEGGPWLLHRMPHTVFFKDCGQNWYLLTTAGAQPQLHALVHWDDTYTPTGKRTGYTVTPVWNAPEFALGYSGDAFTAACTYIENVLRYQQEREGYRWHVAVSIDHAGIGCIGVWPYQTWHEAGRDGDEWRANLKCETMHTAAVAGASMLHELSGEWHEQHRKAQALAEQAMNEEDGETFEQGVEREIGNTLDYLARPDWGGVVEVTRVENYGVQVAGLADEPIQPGALEVLLGGAAAGAQPWVMGDELYAVRQHGGQRLAESEPLPIRLECPSCHAALRGTQRVNYGSAVAICPNGCLSEN